MSKSSSESEAEDLVLAIDNGSSTCRMGFAGDDGPRSVFPNIIGRPAYKKSFSDIFSSRQDSFIGSDAQENREVLSLEYPVQRGLVTNWEDMETIWSHSICEDLKLSSLSDVAVITSEPPLNPRSHAEKIAHVMFESFGVKALHIGLEPEDILFSSGRGSGVVISVGHGLSYAASIYEGASPVAITRSDFGGHDVTMKLQQLLYQRGYSFSTTAELHSLMLDKEKMCFVKNGTGQDSTDNNNRTETYKLPDGSSVELESELHEPCELLFQPDGVFHCGPSIPDLVTTCLQESPVDCRRDLYVNLIISGGTSLTQGFCDRLQSEVKKKIAPTYFCKTVTLGERKYHSWIGKSIHGSLSYFKTIVVSRAEYEEHGPHVIHGNGRKTTLASRQSNSL